MPADRGRDRITLTGVTAYGHHGVLDFEKRDGQEFVVDVVLDLDLSAAAATDDLSTTVSYAEVAADVVEVVTGPALDLIEAVAGRIADRVLARPLVETVTVTVHKPQAPVGVPFGDVAVTVRRDRDEPVVIALGANLGDPARAVRAAGRALHRVRGLRAVRLSPTFGTAPVGGPEQPDYVNAVAVARTRLTPASLLAALHRIEEDHGRTREVRWGPRTLDLDLIQYGTPGTDHEVRTDDPALTLPHPRAHERAFVLAPWAAVDPAAVLRVGEQVVPVTEQLDRIGLDGVTPLTDEPGRGTGA
ncbi:2-amino-4-hydroxy-6-hydroxymethyldihydropteridine diphosphokinase [Ornithinicoccus hortensis]|uniref:Bifunctional folate synthesis protein n=1 Tax=Ornithinicoccus hortensis TaxID=82346 RepID=A0A542YVW5_9MICO|nr:2-amino-4-hydroxy-6-hydroxymethyldihydropteridine diphosphokinase [Ornithinicoccus hortensis]TQL52239.1 dihydroneopterin aldolase/2-amino-4-hydroxy-6-hydroxymethyldihydropteridine diphosphokinase [Ornithinicoccus hortensis]